MNSGVGFTPRMKMNLLIGGGVVALGIVAFLLLRKKDKKNRRNINRQQEDNTSNTGGGNNESNTTTPTPNPTPAVYDTTADRKILHNAMRGAGTNERAIDSLISRTTREQRTKIRQDWDDNKSKYGGDTLREWIEDDYSWWTGESRIIGAFY